MQHVNLKVFAKSAEGVNITEAIPVFHRWIQKRTVPEIVIDVADYSHVSEGPGVLLIAHEANYSLDCARGELGLLYNRKAAAAGSAQESMRQAYDAARAACLLLEDEPEFKNKLSFDPTLLEVFWNDRLLHPNTASGWAEVEPDVRRFFDGVFGAGGYSLTRGPEGRERLSARIRGSAQ